MLILQRKEGESLFIGEDVEVTIVWVVGARVRLAIRAPREVPVLRGELKTAAATNQEAAQEQSSPLALLDLLKGRPD